MDRKDSNKLPLLSDLLSAVREHVPDATEEEIATAALIQFANDNKHIADRAALQLAILVGFFRKNGVGT
jgi:hypothetical protein